MKVFYDGPECYHPGSGLDLKPGELEVTEDQAKQLGDLVKNAAPSPQRRKGPRPERKE